MRNKLLVAALFGAGVAAGVFAACGDGGNGGTSTTCNADGDCQTGEICHPLAHTCVQGCTGATDCPSTNKNCDSLTYGGTRSADGGIVGGQTSAKFCQCATAALCGGGNICASEDKICTTACTSDSACGIGRKCISGDCKTVTEDAGTTDAGNCGWNTCSTPSWTAAGQQCSGSSCGAGPSCSGAAQSTCTYGSYCASGACGYPTFPVQGNTNVNGCDNFYSGQHSNGPQWTPTGSGTAPIIYSVTERGHGSAAVSIFDAQCTGTTTEWIINVKAYLPSGQTWPSARSGVNGFFYVNSSGTNVDIIATNNLITGTGYNVSGQNADFNVYFCANSATSFQPGFYFTGGNEACRQF